MAEAAAASDATYASEDASYELAAAFWTCDAACVASAGAAVAAVAAADEEASTKPSMAPPSALPNTMSAAVGPRPERASMKVVSALMELNTALLNSVRMSRWRLATPDDE